MILTIILFLAALSISGVSAFYSITGLTAIFPGAYWSVIVLCGVLEVGKLSAVAFLHRHWCDAAFLIKTYLVIAILILMLINSMGIFGLLSKAHIAQEVSNAGQASTIQIIQEKITSEKTTITDFDTQIGNLDRAIDKLTQTGRAGQALAQLNAQRKTRDKLSQEKMAHQSAYDDLSKQEVEKNNANKVLESDFGPLQYLADFIYGSANAAQLENTVRWVISIIVFVTDPLAIILLVSASFSLTTRKKGLTSVGKEDMMLIHDDYFKE
jgi:hypothetical protein